MQLGIKGVLLAALGIALGIGAAWGFFNFQVANTKESFFDGQWSPQVAKPEQEAALKLTVEGLNPRDLGRILTGTKTDIDFLVRNPGNRKTRFRMSGPPPSALSVDLPSEGADIAPGSTYPVTITVVPTAADLKFNRTIVLQTDDGARTVLTVTAQVDGGLGLSSKELTISRSELNSELVKEVELICATTDQIRLSKILFNGQDELPSWLRIEPLEMNSELLSNSPGAKSGWLLRLAFSPDLPGDIREAKLELITDQPEFVPQVVTLKFTE